MSGHNKWSKIKHKKGAEDAKRSKVFSRLSKLITAESKKANGDVSSPGLATVIESAKKENMPKDTIERAVRKGTDSGTLDMDPVTYEAYGPGGSALIIEALTDNKNRAAAEVRHSLSKNGHELAAPGAASWAFSREGHKWVANTTVELSESDIEKLERLIDSIEESDDVQEVFTNVA
ncbi:MAG: YebC/PmpR family DNA-binding regulatory protein [Candidatus Paceibacteria bacterium]|jgi:YebC/PmpR family DNA-binding regulatory protein